MDVRDSDHHVHPRHCSECPPALVAFGEGLMSWVLTVRAQHLCFDVQRAIDGFIAHGRTETGTLDFYNNLSNPTHVGKSVIYITQTLVGDAFVVRPDQYPLLRFVVLTVVQNYRLFIVYNRNPWILVLPLALVVGTGGRLAFYFSSPTGTVH